MKTRQWQVQRQLHPCPEGHQRWDRAYQLLLFWTNQNHPPRSPQEVTHANSSVCSRLRSPARPESEY
jgi:hypothetical protein